MFPGNNYCPSWWHNKPRLNTVPKFQRKNLDVLVKNEAASQRSTKPITPCTSIVGIKFDSGVMIAADYLVSCGSPARCQDIQRVFKINRNTIIGAGGDYSNFQRLKRYMDQKIVEDAYYENNITKKPKSLYKWFTKTLYYEKCRLEPLLEPLWIETVVGGMEDGEPFLGHVDLRGRSYQDTVIATGFGKHLALPLLTERLEANKSINQEDALKLIKKCMSVLYYPNCSALSKYHLAICTEDTSILQGPVAVGEHFELSISEE